MWPVPPVKRHKPSPCPHRHRQSSPGFWDRLSRVQLSQQALRDFDHRTLNRRDRTTPPPPTALLLDLPKEPGIKLLQRFARRGGPVLTHLCEMSPAATFQLLNYANVDPQFASFPFPMSTSNGPSLKRGSILTGQ